MHRLVLLSALFLLAACNGIAETLPPLVEERPPQTVAEMWAGFDPRADPLETEILHEWEEDGVVLRVVRFRIGIFKGQKAMLAGVYGFPKGARNLPGLLQIHGGGQYADYHAPLVNAKRGYATLSIAWAGRITAPEYNVSPEVVELFWQGAMEDPNYRVTTDWGALDAYHAPSRHEQTIFPRAEAHPWTLDSIESPRNCPWFLVTLAARRGLTFLERQPEVDGERLGVYGHSMGGKLTVLTTAADSRVKAAAPSCGGVSDRYNPGSLYRATIGDDANLAQITCPIIFLSPANDFHGRIDDLQSAVRELKTEQWRVTCSPHHNHQDNAEGEVATLLWFDQHLRGTFTWPATPASQLYIDSDTGTITYTVTPDPAMPIESVEVYYTQQGQSLDDNHVLEAIHRYWRYAHPTRGDSNWTASLETIDPTRPLWVYAHVRYRLPEPVTGAGYYYRIYTAESFNVSTTMAMLSPEQLRSAGVRATAKPTTILESFGPHWEREWFTYHPDGWARRTLKLGDEMRAAPVGGRLQIEVRSQRANVLVLGIDEFAAEVSLPRGNDWQRITLAPADFRDALNQPMPDWQNRKELRFGPNETLYSPDRQTSRTTGTHWKGAAPEFRVIQWTSPDVIP